MYAANISDYYAEFSSEKITSIHSNIGENPRYVIVKNDYVKSLINIANGEQIGKCFAQDNIIAPPDLELPIFDGTTDFGKFLQNFRVLRKFYKWSTTTAALYFRDCLRGRAAVFYSRLPTDTWSCYGLLETSFQHHYGPRPLYPLEQLWGAKQSEDEDLYDFALRIISLGQWTSPDDAAKADREGVGQFLRGCRFSGTDLTIPTNVTPLPHTVAEALDMLLLQGHGHHTVTEAQGQGLDEVWPVSCQKSSGDPEALPDTPGDSVTLVEDSVTDAQDSVLEEVGQLPCHTLSSTTEVKSLGAPEASPGAPRDSVTLTAVNTDTESQSCGSVNDSGSNAWDSFHNWEELCNVDVRHTLIPCYLPAGSGTSSGDGWRRVPAYAKHTVANFACAGCIRHVAVNQFIKVRPVEPEFPDYFKRVRFK
jgi:hypothetical protein